MAKKQDSSSTETQTEQAAPAAAPEKKLPENLWKAQGGAGYDLLIEAESRDLAVALACAYTGLEQAALVFSRPKALPAAGDPILRGKQTQGGIFYERGRYRRAVS